MSRDVAELLTEAVPGDIGGPDLDVIEARATRRRRSVGAAVALVAVTLVAGLVVLLPRPPARTVIGQLPAVSGCPSSTNVDQVLDEVDLDDDGVGDHVGLVASESGTADLVLCLADGRVLTTETGWVVDQYALQPAALGGIDGVALVDVTGVGTRRHVHLVWLVDEEPRHVSTWQDAGPDGSTTMGVIDYRGGTDASDRAVRGESG